MLLSIAILFIFRLLVSVHSLNTTDCDNATSNAPVDMISKRVLTSPWIDIGVTLVDDQEWVLVTSSADVFENASVFVSLPDIGGNTSSSGFPVIPRVRNVEVLSGIVSFETLLYQANDSFCSKEWYIPKSVTPAVSLAWIVAENGAYNVSDSMFLIGIGPITREDNDISNSNNFIRFNFPTGCEAIEASCAYPVGSTVGVILQLQTVVYNRLLIPRTKVVNLRFFRAVLQPHDSLDPSYYSMNSLGETLAYMSFSSGTVLTCSDGLALEAFVIPGVNDVAQLLDFNHTFSSLPGIFGTVGTATSLSDCTGLRTFSRTINTAGLITQEDQCVDEETVHSTLEVVFVLVVGEQSKSSCTQCAAFHQSLFMNPTSLPSALSISSVGPTSTPMALTEMPSVEPSRVTTVPTATPSVIPTFLTSIPSTFPTSNPYSQPTNSPSVSPSTSSQPSGTAGDVIDMVSKSFVTELWMEVSRVNASDLYWVSVVTETSGFNDAVVFVSIPPYANSESPLVPRVRNIISSAYVSFEMKLYHANDTYCAKDWYIPSALTDTLEVSWMVVEKGAFNVSGFYFMVGSGDITRQDNTNGNYNFIRFNYPTGCLSSTESCRFEDGTTVGSIQQIQSLVYDRFLSSRALINALSFSRFVLVPHDSEDLSYYNMTSAEGLAYMAFQGSGVLNCLERIAFEMGQHSSVTSASTSITLEGEYSRTVSVFGMVSSVTSMSAATSLRAWNLTSIDFQISLQEDQCTTEEHYHSTQEFVSYIVVGEQLHVTSPIACKVKFDNNFESSSPTIYPTGFPTSLPSDLPMVLPSVIPSSNPSPAPTVVLSSMPSTHPTVAPSEVPSGLPSAHPTSYPTVVPSEVPSGLPSARPTSCPTFVPSEVPSGFLSVHPTSCPTFVPSDIPSGLPSVCPTSYPTVVPSEVPSGLPSVCPTPCPTFVPSEVPSGLPSVRPTSYPTVVPSEVPSGLPSVRPTPCPTFVPSEVPSGFLSVRPTSYPTVVPSEVPSGLPSVRPTPCPTFVPSEVPSGLPSVRPTPCPTFVPSEVSSGFLSVHPTLCPTFVPSDIPSGLPSVRPTSYPTVVPSEVPSGLPSVCPTPCPTFVPSEVPSGLPSVRPTSYPTVVPSEVPSGLPSVRPTSYPTVVPSEVPSGLPSVRPTPCPTFVPSEVPSGLPLATPSMVPTRILEPDCDISSYLSSRIASEINRGAYQLNFHEVLPSDTHNGVTLNHKWGSFLQRIRSLHGAHVPVSMDTTLLVAENSSCLMSHFTRLHYSCSTSEHVVSIWNALLNHSYASVLCNGASWVVKSCEYWGTVRLCINCTSPCNSTRNLALPTSVAAIQKSTYAAYIGFRTIYSETWPEWTQTCRSTTANSITVTLNTSTSGVYYCQAFDATDGLPKATYQRIYAYGKSLTVYSQRNETHTIVFLNLHNQTAYRVLCVSHSLNTHYSSVLRSPAVYSGTKSCFLRTKGKSVIYLESIDQILIANSSAAQIVIRLARHVDSLLIVTPVIYYGSSGICENSENLLPYSAVFPSALKFNDSDTVLTKSFYIGVHQAGCLHISLNVSGHNSDLYYVHGISSGGSYSGDHVILRSIESSTHVSAPSVDNVKLTADGSRLLVTFDSATDRGRGYGIKRLPFTCSQFIIFEVAMESICVFTSDRVLQVTLSSDLDRSILFSRNSTVRLVGGVVGAKCGDINHNCPKMNASTNIILPPDSLTQPRASINAAADLTAYMDLHLDTAGSTGSWGGSWAHIEWTVSGPEPTNQVIVEDYLNKNLSWFGCTPGKVSCDVVPRTILMDGTYVFILSLTNILGISSTSSVTVHVNSSVFIPSITISGPSIRTVTPNSTLNLLADVNTSPMFDMNETYDFVWDVYRDGYVYLGVHNSAIRDPRRYIAGAYSLDAGHTYTFQAKVTLDGVNYGTAEVYVHTVPGDIVTTINGGSHRTMAYSSTLVLDTSSSFDSNTGSYDGLSTHWQCVQIFPVNESGCDGFNSLGSVVSEENSVVVMINISDVFYPSSTYILSVDIIGSDGRVGTSAIRLSIGAYGDVFPDISIDSPTSKFVDWSSPTLLSATVSAKCNFKVQWLESGTSIPLASKVFNLSGTVVYHHQIQPYEFIPGATYTFIIHTESYDCAEGSVSSAAISFAFNEPPRSGDFRVDPTSGDSESPFTLVASHWLDDHLPLRYSFSRHLVASLFSLLSDFSEVSHEIVFLADGDLLQNFTVILLLQISDSLSCVSNASTQALVFPSSYNISEQLGVYRMSFTSDKLRKDSNALLQLSVRVTNSLNTWCQTSYSHTYGSDCYGLSDLGFRLFSKLLSAGEYTVNFIEAIVGDATHVIHHCTVSDYIDKELITSFAVDMASAITSLSFDGKATIYRSLDFFTYVDSTIGMLYNGHEDEFSRRHLSDLEPLKRVLISSTINVAHQAFDALTLGQSFSDLRNLTYLRFNILKTWPDEAMPVDFNRTHGGTVHMEPSLAKNIQLSSSSYGALILFITLPHSLCTLERLCHQITPTVYITYFVSSKYNLSSVTPYMDVDLSLTSLLNISTDVDLSPTTYYQDCSGSTASINFTCSEDDTGGYTYTFTNVSCDSYDSTLELICPVYGVKIVCTDEFVESRDVVVDDTKVLEGTMACGLTTPFHYSNDDKLPYVKQYDVYFLSTYTSGVLSTSLISDADLNSMTIDDGIVASRSSSDGAQHFTTYPATSTILAVMSITIFLLAIWLSKATGASAVKVHLYSTSD